MRNGALGLAAFLEECDVCHTEVTSPMGAITRSHADGLSPVSLRILMLRK